MTSRQIFTTLLIALGLSASAQKFELGKVSIEELKQTRHPLDTLASAAVLFEKGTVNITYQESEGFLMTTEVKVRIKIYKKEGYEWATKQVRYYLPSNYKESVSFDDAVTYNLVNGEIVKTKLKSDGEFNEAVNKYWGRRKITMPAVKEGSVIEYAYRIKSPNFHRIDNWSFQTTIPVNYSEYKTLIPEYFVYNPNFKGFIFPKVTTEKVSKAITFKEKERVSNGYMMSTNFSTSKIDYTETQTTYLAQNMPAMKDESYVNNIGNYTSSVGLELSFTKFPNTTPKTYSTDWETVVKTIYEDDDFGSELEKTGYFEADINNLVSGIKVQDEMVTVIYNYVKTNVKWNSYTGYNCQDGVKSAYKNKSGNVAEVNLMLTSMLRHAGITATPVLISTRDNGIALFPNRTAFNYVICAVDTPSGRLLLDATEKYAMPNVLPMRDINWFGRLIRKDGSSEQIDLIPKNISRETIFLNYAIRNDGMAEGKIRNQFTDYTALNFRQKHVMTNQDAYLEALENENNHIEIGDYIRENDAELSKPIVETYTFKDSKSTEIISNKIYISPLLFLSADENPFKQEKREYPVDFGYPTQRKYNISVEIPEGYAIESMPKGINLSTGDDLGNFKYLIASNGNKIQITIIADVNAAIVPAEYYDVIKAFYQKMIEQQSQKIVLVKT